ncbi:hypothetical protein [Lentzea terrae]|uniref:hypothetical protein n=1 Tax=Lentzea terrae TaxID=2200761 RepID=UPI000DD31223|nr:hypothetical protein [Lentzea terrae]
MEILVIVVAVAVITALVLRGPRQAKARTQAAASRTPSLMPLAESLGGKLAGPGEASAWSRALQRAQHKPGLSLEFHRGPWHVRVTEASYAPDALLPNNQMSFEHWIEVATIPLPRRRVPLEFFTLYFEDGFARVECDGQIRPDELEFLVDMILETLDLMPGVEPRDPTTVI